MDKKYYKTPLNIRSFFEENNTMLSRCTLLESIDNNLDMIISTCPGEHGFNPDYGCDIWDMDFERVVSRSKWEESFLSHILKAIVKNEKRLTNVKVKIEMKDVLTEGIVQDTVSIRKRVKIIVLANLVETNQNCGFAYSIYMGPLSSE